MGRRGLLMRRSGFRRVHLGRGLLCRGFLLWSRLLGGFLGSLLRSLLGRFLHGLLGFFRGFFRRLLRGFFGGFLFRGENLFTLLRLLAFLLLRFSHVVLLLR